MEVQCVYCEVGTIFVTFVFKFSRRHNSVKFCLGRQPRQIIHELQRFEDQPYLLHQDDVDGVDLGKSGFYKRSNAALCPRKPNCIFVYFCIYFGFEKPYSANAHKRCSSRDRRRPTRQALSFTFILQTYEFQLRRPLWLHNYLWKLRSQLSFDV